MSNHYHYIITGAGLAGSSLLMRMMEEPFFSKKRILVIDICPKTKNDRTWCFWEKDTGLFESIVHHTWNEINFFSANYADTFPISPYQYKMIRSVDLYSAVANNAEKHPNIEWRFAEVKAINNKNDSVAVVTDAITYTADYVFNSILFNERTFSDSANEKSAYLLLQHFKGWFIQTTEPQFNPEQATFMDFRVSQNKGTTFMYLMPITTTTALIEYTLFSKELLQQEAYDHALRAYLSTYLHNKDYLITQEEFGIIPMTNKRFPRQNGRVVYLGIAGGQVKGSSGYTFQFIQKRTKLIVNSLLKTGTVSLQASLSDKKFQLYDSILLNVLSNARMNGDEIFTAIFKKNPAKRVLRFLDNETTLWEDLQIMRSVPMSVFLPAMLQEI